ncbi:permease prefix domain 1-containing protein [Streptomyces sp. NPDC127098]|uniref:permease prefix domain 1-containing protein n=1 Tax=Streptomyces sp. NPDC127098 TaxID=3347137 RepID=UPI00365EB4B0
MTGTDATGATDAIDPLDAYVATLAAELHGPAPAKARLLTEIRDGLDDTVAAHAQDGTPYRHALDLALREFGTPEELVASCQRELTLAQVRHTARTVALAAPPLLAGWLLSWHAGGADDGLGWAARLLAGCLVAVAVVAALPAVAALAATGPLARRLPVPARLPELAAWTGTVSALAAGAAALTLAVSAPLTATWPLLVLAAALAVGSHTRMAASARACRRCARLPVSAGGA